MATCPHCGSDSLRQRMVDNRTALECLRCGEFSGDAAAEQFLHDKSAAAQRGMDDSIFPFVKLLENQPGCAVLSASSGDADLLIPPFVSFHVEPGAARQLEKLLTSLRNYGGTRCRWIVQATLQPGLCYELKPDFAVLGYALRRQDIAAAVADLPQLLQHIERDSQLAWWTK